MICEHELPVKSKCPINGVNDFYECRVIVDRFVTCEEIVKACEQFQNKKIYQETLTQKLADDLKATVVTTGHHAAGVLLTVTCEAAK